MQRAIEQCRVCGNKNLATIVNLGNQSFTGVFPRSKGEDVETGALELVKCIQNSPEEHCGLVQLGHSWDLELLYGDNYGYRSSLNGSMVKHLKHIVDQAKRVVQLNDGDFVLDIGSNDGTLLKCYESETLNLVGIDPTATESKFGIYYPDYIQRICDFFSSERVKLAVGDQKAKVITSIAMFYDLERPQDFVRDVRDVLDPDGIWVFEQSYLPTMVKKNSYDTICHEHLEYYGLYQIKWMLDRNDLKIVDLELNAINGGSFRVTAAHRASQHSECSDKIESMLSQELNFHKLSDFDNFRSTIEAHRTQLKELFRQLSESGKKVVGYGASTKGNVVLQYCGISPEDMVCIAEVNEEKFGAYTPGTLIPIVSEPEAKALEPDYFFVLPWHFKENIMLREQDSLKSGLKFIFPLPEIQIVSSSGEQNFGA